MDFYDSLDVEFRAADIDEIYVTESCETRQPSQIPYWRIIRKKGTLIKLDIFYVVYLSAIWCVNLINEDVYYDVSVNGIEYKDISITHNSFTSTYSFKDNVRDTTIVFNNINQPSSIKICHNPANISRNNLYLLIISTLILLLILNILIYLNNFLIKKRRSKRIAEAKNHISENK